MEPSFFLTKSTGKKERNKGKKRKSVRKSVRKKEAEDGRTRKPTKGEIKNDKEKRQDDV
jgi:hypothetical protein